MGELFAALRRPALYSAIARDVVAGATNAVRLPVMTRDRGRVAVERVPTAVGNVVSGLGGVATPVLLVHGYGGTEAVWEPVARRLSRAGFADVRLLRYDAFRLSVHDVAARLVDHAHVAMTDTGSSAVHLVGHSLGGLVVRYAVQCRGFYRHAMTVATVATPHRGTHLAYIASGPSAADLRPGSATLVALEAAPCPPGVRWVAYYSTTDLVAPPSAAVLRGTAFDATNVLVPNVGHLSIVDSPSLADSLVDQLLLSQRLASAPAARGQAA